MICESSTRSVKKNFGFKGDSLWVDWYEPFFDFVKQNDVRAISHYWYRLTAIDGKREFMTTKKMLLLKVKYRG